MVAVESEAKSAAAQVQRELEQPAGKSVLDFHRLELVLVENRRTGQERVRFDAVDRSLALRPHVSHASLSPSRRMSFYL